MVVIIMKIRVVKIPNPIRLFSHGLRILLSVSLVLLSASSLAESGFIDNKHANSAASLSAAHSPEIYFLKSRSLRPMYHVNQIKYRDHEGRIAFFKEMSQSFGFNPKDISASQLSSLDKRASLIVLDMMSLSNDEVNYIENFVKRGGSILFNFTSGFLDTSLNHRKDNLVYRITGLMADKKAKSAENAMGFLSTSLFSPLTTYLPEGKTLDLFLYDPLPIFNNSEGVSVAGYFTNWLQTNYPTVNLKGEKEESQSLSEEQSGLIWHGNKGQGKWVYFSFPSYVFLESSQEQYKKLFKGMLGFLKNKATLVPFPYIDAKNVVFVSLDAEHDYHTLEQYYDVIEKHNFPTTVFAVASLALLDEDLTVKVAQSENIEMGSHSYSHGQIVGKPTEVYKKEIIEAKSILQKLTGHEIYGMRPPREEIDDKLLRMMDDSQHKYAFGALENVLFPYYRKDVLIIPRNGTDDYSYLITLGWSPAQILEEMKRQVNVITGLNGIYTFNAHTHLMSFGSNIEIIDNFLSYVNQQDHLTPMNGKMIYDRVSKIKNIQVDMELTRRNLIFMIDNTNSYDVNNMHFHIFVNSNMVLTNTDKNVELTKLSDTKYEMVFKNIPAKISQREVLIGYEVGNG